MVYILVPVCLIAILCYYLFFVNQVKKVNGEIPSSWIAVLETKVTFYINLNENDRLRFQQDCYNFLQLVKVVGVKGVDVDLQDRLLVASSAVIPLFGFPDWMYKSIKEVILYPSAFDRSFQLNNPNEVITGMVGSGIMEGKMILSKPALTYGFENDNDKDNVGIHEFVHLFDKEDGLIDGVPKGFDSNVSTLVWLDLMKVKIKEIERNKSNIKEYGATNHQEFFAVASEYFFESPKLLQKKHPELYQMLSDVFNQDLASTLTIKRTGVKLKRNQSCVCGSGLKYKNCCMA